MAIKTENIAPNTWLFDENGGITLYLIAGEERAVLIDTGFDGSWLPEAVKALTDKPVMLVHSHAHGDHTGGDMLWGELWMHEAEFDDLLSQPGHGELKLHPLADGDVIDLGNRTLEVIHIPGHSPGSIALLDKQGRILFSGDTVMAQPVFLQNPNSSYTDFAASQKKLLARADEFDRIYPCHDVWPVGKQDMEDLLACAERAIAGEEPEDTPISMPGPGGGGWETIPFRGFKKGRVGVVVEGPEPPKA